jgi:hypothetical protein
MKTYLPLLLFLILLSGCNSFNNNQQTPVVEDIVPTPRDTNTCTITGLLYENTKTPTPVVGASLYLGEIVNDSQGNPIMTTMNRIQSLRAITSANGKFSFVDVPGNNSYSLIFDVVTESYMLYDPDTSNDLLFKCEGGKITDLGKLIYSDLP